MNSPKLTFASSMVPVLLSLLLIVLLHFRPEISPEEKTHLKLTKLDGIPLVGGAIGPESFVFDSLGEGPYTGVSDGRVIRWDSRERRWVDFAITSPDRNGCEGLLDHHEMEHICGRPLGLRFNKSNGDLYIADAYYGLMKVGPKGGLATKVVTHAQGIQLAFTNSLDIDLSSNVVYFTDSSSRYHRRDHIQLMLAGDRTGRLMKYDPQSQEVTLLLDNLGFANGVELSTDANFLLVVETLHCRVLRYWIKTPRVGTVEVFAQLPGFPDNIKKSPRGGYWVAIHSTRGKLAEWTLQYPQVGAALFKLPFGKTKIRSSLDKLKKNGMLVRLGENGEVLESLEDKSWKSLSEVVEKDGELLLGSIVSPSVIRYKM